MIVHNIKNVTPASLADAVFGRKLELMQEIKPWKEKASQGWLDCRHKTWKIALREFKKLNNVKEYFIQCPDQTAKYPDDSIRIYYTSHG